MDWDDAYANGAHIAGAAEYPPRWTTAAQGFREQAQGRLDLPYGPDPRQRFDLFSPAGDAAGVLVFVHGGYWRAFDKSTWSHLAAGAVARGWAVAVPSYRLAPQVHIRDITQDIHAALLAIAEATAGPIVLTGHSAGGHLVARMLCDDQTLPPKVAERIVTCVPISPLSDLRPLMNTAMNDEFRLDEGEALAESPALRRNAMPVPVTVWVGGDERPAFLDQARWLEEAWVQARLHIDAGKHHFDVIDGLQDPGSPLMQALLG